MSVTGVESIVYGVADVDECIRFFHDFGLGDAIEHDGATQFTMPDQTRILLRDDHDEALPPRWYDGIGVREIVFGVDSPESLADIVASLSAETEVAVGDNGVTRFADPDGIAYGLAVFEKRPITCVPESLNAPGHVGRLNRTRKWFAHATPRGIQHVVMRVAEPERSFDFLKRHLDLRLSDVSRGLGIFGRFSGTNEHHNVFFQRADLLPHSPVGWDHVCIAVEDIDEMMVGANHMQRQGWRSELGIGRHRISSALFYYVESPAGGAVEYGADTDVLDDNWVPRVFEPMFGYLTWTSEVPPFMPSEATWDVEFVGDADVSTLAGLAVGEPDDEVRGHGAADHGEAASASVEATA